MKINNKEIIIKEKKLDKIYIDKIIEKDITITLRYIKNNKTYYDKFIKHNCGFCDKEVYINQKTLSINPISFCNSNCMALYHKQKNDPKNYEIMNKIHTLNVCYYIGLLAADGTITYPAKNNKYKGYRARLQLQEQDKDILEKLQNLFGGTLNCYTINTLKSKTWQHELTNKEFVLYLKSIGLTIKKSRTLDVYNWFNILKYDQKIAFIKGFVDGDGSIYSQEQNNKKWYKVKISSCSQKLIKMLLDFLNGTNLTFHLYVDSKSGCSTISTHGKNTIPFINQLMSVKTVSLNRKNEKMNELLDFYKTVSSHDPSG